MTDLPEKKTKVIKYILIEVEFLEEFAHTLGSLAQYYMDNYTLKHGEPPDITKEDALLTQACEYLNGGEE